MVQTIFVGLKAQGIVVGRIANSLDPSQGEG